MRLLSRLCLLTIALPYVSSLGGPALPYPKSEDAAMAREIKATRPEANPAEIADQIMIGPRYFELLQWMREDLVHYLQNFDPIFDAKLERISKHQVQRLADREQHTAALRNEIATRGTTKESQAELSRLNELHKPHAFVAPYSNADDFIRQFVGPKGKLLKAPPTSEELAKMNRGGNLFVDTWAVPFFNTATQTRAEAKEGIKKAIEAFSHLPPNISLRKFTELTALFARPEFDDVRRYKLLPFPRGRDIERFGAERNDAKTFGDKYPEDVMVVINRPIDLGPVSYIFGQKVHILGLIPHSTEERTADGRIFTGPADFLEHDFAHAFFNLSPAIPGSPEDWEKVHREFIEMRDKVTDKRLRDMMRLVYYHFTHESGFTVLNSENGNGSAYKAFENELNVIKELLGTRFHYDFILSNNQYADGYQPYLENAFHTVGTFFRNRFLSIRQAAKGDGCNRLFAQTAKRIEKEGHHE